MYVPRRTHGARLTRAAAVRLATDDTREYPHWLPAAPRRHPPPEAAFSTMVLPNGSTAHVLMGTTSVESLVVPDTRGGAGRVGCSVVAEAMLRLLEPALEGPELLPRFGIPGREGSVPEWE